MEAAGIFPCPCCGNTTLPEAPPGTFFICPVCRWEDDNVQFADPAYAGGANRVSLDEARARLRSRESGAETTSEIREVPG